MNKEECKNQIESLIDAWKLEEADLNQTDINAMEEMIALIDKSESNWKALKEWLIEQRKYDHGEDKYGDTLDKMNELESDKE